MQKRVARNARAVRARCTTRCVRCGRLSLNLQKNNFTALHFIHPLGCSRPPKTSPTSCFRHWCGCPSFWETSNSWQSEAAKGCVFLNRVHVTILPHDATPYLPQTSPTTTLSPHSTFLEPVGRPLAEYTVPSWRLVTSPLKQYESSRRVTVGRVHHLHLLACLGCVFPYQFSTSDCRVPLAIPRKGCAAALWQLWGSSGKCPCVWPLFTEVLQTPDSQAGLMADCARRGSCNQHWPLEVGRKKVGDSRRRGQGVSPHPPLSPNLVRAKVAGRSFA